MSTDASTGASGATPMRTPLVTSGPATDAARAVRFDRPLLDQPAWADPRMARQLAESARAAREQGMAEGYAAGWAQGRRAADEAARTEARERADREEAARKQLAGRAQSLLASLAQTARTFSEDVSPAWDEIVDVLLDGAFRVASASLGRELEATDAEVLEAARTALRILPGTEVVAVHVNPADAALVAAEDLPTGVSVVPDSTVAVGTVVARSSLQSLPVNLRRALDSVEEVLRG